MWQWIMFFLLTIVILALIEESLQYFLNKYLRDEEMAEPVQRLKYYAKKLLLFIKGKLKRSKHF